MRMVVQLTTPPSKSQRLIVGLLLTSITLAGVIACGNWFSFLMLVLLGAHGLLLVVETLTDGVVSA